ncbi:MBL fold metallo-hydrolase [Gorillibacterium timonense]|uniref:MBL fold metallo-hydrolase n=1 Tax=Gorillibacterium timonense TaxID=1689269 RepID=UPI00071CC13E|nr:MBL fold metallo-hydrolase [Gorillibacterium timonense]
MRIRHKHSLYQLTFLPRFFPVNSYFVEEADGLTLIDAALPYSAKGILRAAEHIGKPISRIVLTHAHGDHLGALDALKLQLPHVPVYLSARDVRLLDGDLSLDADEPGTPIRGDIPKKLQTRPDVLLHDGDRLGSLLTVSAPGHTPGSMAFLDTRNQTLIAGDAFQLRGGIAVSGQLRITFPFPAMATWNADRALATARKLADLQPTLLAVGHGSLLEQPTAAMEQAIRTAQAAIGGKEHVTSNRS